MRETAGAMGVRCLLLLGLGMKRGAKGGRVTGKVMGERGQGANPGEGIKILCGLEIINTSTLRLNQGLSEGSQDGGSSNGFFCSDFCLNMDTTEQAWQKLVTVYPSIGKNIHIYYAYQFRMVKNNGS